MQYMTLETGQREALLASLADMPEFLRATLARLTPEQARTPAPDGTPSPVEQVWHLADLEREGYGERIRRLLAESEPYLPDFDGGKIAAARNYRLRTIDKGLVAFADARAGNLEAFRALSEQSWVRRGTQEGVGSLSLCDIPGFMAQHDAAHRREIDSWKRSIPTW